MANERASKKQRELLSFIDGFIKGNNYGPSYREIMRALGYKSVSTVATHVDGLVTKGYLRKRDNSARSIEVVSLATEMKQPDTAHTQWLKREVKKQIDSGADEETIKTLQAALKILGIADENDDQLA